jgi:hypothetical protein
MTTDRPAPTPPARTPPARAPSAFRLNLEQQRIRAKELLRAAKGGDAEALARLPRKGSAPLKLADAQLAIARELRFPSWAKLKSHIEAMDRERAAIEHRQPAPDGGLKTLHIRCGSDIQFVLQEAGFVGGFLEHSNPYCQGPVTNGPERHELRARFVSDSLGRKMDPYGEVHEITYEGALAASLRDEELLHQSAEDYERVVLWMEHDSYDQLVLVRLLSHYANAKRPRVLELIAVNQFPGPVRFIGLGQLPSEALRMLWPSRRAVTEAQLTLGNDAWLALTSPDPRALAALARSGTPALPIMAPALHRHLRELPSVENGLSLVEHLILQVLAEGPTTFNRLLRRHTYELEPLPWLGDWGTLGVLNDMAKATEPVFTRTRKSPDESAYQQEITITDVGLEVLRGERDWHTLKPVPRWVGGVYIEPGEPGWRWNEARCEAVMTAPRS